MNILERAVMSSYSQRCWCQRKMLQSLHTVESDVKMRSGGKNKSRNYRYLSQTPQPELPSNIDFDARCVTSPEFGSSKIEVASELLGVHRASCYINRGRIGQTQDVQPEAIGSTSYSSPIVPVATPIIL